MSRAYLGAVVLMVMGIVVLFYSGVRFPIPGETVSLLGLRLGTQLLSPAIGAAALLGGIALFVSDRRATVA